MIAALQNMDGYTLAIAVAAMVCLVCLVLGIRQTLNAPANPRIARLEEYIEKRRRPIDEFRGLDLEEEIQEGKRQRSPTADLLPLVTNLINNSRNSFFSKLGAQLRLINSNWRASEVVYLSVFLCFAGAALAGWWTKGLVPVVVAVGAGGLVAPILFVRLRVARWMTRFERQLADTLSLMASSIRAGYSFPQAMDMIAEEGLPPMSREFDQMRREMNLGRDFEEAFQSMQERVQSTDLDIVVTSVLIAREIGGNLSNVLSTIASTIRERVRIRGEIRVLTAQGRLTGLLLSMLPLGLFVVLSFISRGNDAYLKPLLETKAGHIMIGLGIFSQVVGFLIIQRIVSIDI